MWTIYIISEDHTCETLFETKEAAYATAIKFYKEHEFDIYPVTTR